MKNRFSVHLAGNRLWAASLLLLLLLQACAPSNATPTVSVAAIYTAAYETNIAQHATDLAMTPPTPTETPSPVPTLPAALPTLPLQPLPTLAQLSTLPAGGVSTACDSAVYAGDVTVQDGTIMAPGKVFTKTWQILNKGTCTWDKNYKLQYDSGDQMNGSSVALTTTVASGSVTNISVTLTAPTANGSYKGTWRMHNAAGTVFGDFLTVVIKVTSGSAATAGAACATTCTISGYAGAASAVMTYDDGGTKTVNADGSGNYSITVPSGWSGTITPSKGKYVFSPASQHFSNVTTNTTFNFSAEDVTPTVAPTSTP